MIGGAQAHRLAAGRGGAARGAGDAQRRQAGPGRAVLGRRVVANLFGKFLAKFRSFSAVSAPIFASKYALCSIFQNLQDYLAENFEIWQDFANFATFAKCC